jgi:WD40 repeat protein
MRLATFGVVVLLLLAGCGPTGLKSVASQSPSLTTRPAGTSPGVPVSPSPGAASEPRTNPPPGVASAGRTNCPAAQPAAAFASSTPTGRYLELVTLKGSTTDVVRDVTDVNHPFTVSTLGGLAPISGPRAAYDIHFASPSDVSYYDDSGRLLRRSFDGTPVAVAVPCNYLFSFAWSPDGASAAYVTDDASSATGELHVVAAGVDRSIHTVPPVPLADCMPPCEDWVDLRLLFSPDGKYVAFADSWGAPYIGVWTTPASSSRICRARIDLVRR